MFIIPRFFVDPNSCFVAGKPCIKCTIITVELILLKLSEISDTELLYFCKNNFLTKLLKFDIK